MLYTLHLRLFQVHLVKNVRVGSQMEQSETLGHLLAFLPDYTGSSLSYCGKAWTPLSWVETTELFLLPSMSALLCLAIDSF